MNSKLLITAVAILSLSGLGATYLYLQFEKQEQQRILGEKQLAQEQERLAFEKQKLRREQLQSLFDVYLNDFRIEIRDSTAAYKANRKILSDMIKPKNFASPAYAKENYDLFKNSIAPSLRKGAQDIIGIFEKYRAKIEKQTLEDDGDLIENFNAQWREETDEQLGYFVDLFADEEERIQDYDALITFYYTHSKLYNVDENLKIFVFDRDEDVATHNKLLGRIKKRSTPDISKNTETEQ